MTRIGATDARTNLYRIIANTAQTNQPVTITSKNGNAVLISEADWQAIQETLYLNGIPGMVESIRKASAEGPDESVGIDEVDWDTL